MVSIGGALRRARELFRPAPLSEAAFRASITKWQMRFYDDPSLNRESAENFVRAFDAKLPSILYRAKGAGIGDQQEVTDTFNRIYATDMWGSGSGGGSGLYEHVAMYLGYVETFIIRNKVRRIVDIGCGDWQFTRMMNRMGADYIGIDAAEQVVSRNTARFGGWPGVSFMHHDASTGFPDCDLVISKDVLQHLNNATVQAILTHVADRPNAIVTNDYHPANADCQNGDTRPLDITLPPFSAKATPRLAFDGKVTFVAGDV